MPTPSGPKAGALNADLGHLGPLDLGAAYAHAVEIISGELNNDFDNLLLLLHKQAAPDVVIQMQTLIAYMYLQFVRKYATHANGVTSVLNEPANDGFQVATTEITTNSSSHIYTSEAGKPIKVAVVLAHDINDLDNVRLALVSDDSKKTAYLIKNKVEPATVADLDPKDELLNWGEVEININNAISQMNGLRVPVLVEKESLLPPIDAAMENGTSFLVEDMDISKPGFGALVWLNRDVSTTVYQIDYDQVRMPDMISIDFDLQGRLRITPDVQALIDGAVQWSQSLKVEATSTATDQQFLTAKNVFVNYMGGTLSELNTNAKTLIPAINELAPVGHVSPWVCHLDGQRTGTDRCHWIATLGRNTLTELCIVTHGTNITGGTDNKYAAFYRIATDYTRIVEWECIKAHPTMDLYWERRYDGTGTRLYLNDSTATDEYLWIYSHDFHAQEMLAWQYTVATLPTSNITLMGPDWGERIGNMTPWDTDYSRVGSSNVMQTGKMVNVGGVVTIKNDWINDRFPLWEITGVDFPQNDITFWMNSSSVMRTQIVTELTPYYLDPTRLVIENCNQVNFSTASQWLMFSFNLMYMV